LREGGRQKRALRAIPGLRIETRARPFLLYLLRAAVERASVILPELTFRLMGKQQPQILRFAQDDSWRKTARSFALLRMRTIS
jgi:hypothetical protein